MSIATTSALNSARLQAVADFLDTGTGHAAVQVYGGTRATSTDAAPGSAMLVSITLAKPCGVVADGVLTLASAGNALITNSGTATWARVVNGAGSTAFDCDAGEGAGAWEIQLVQGFLYAGGDAALQSAVLG